MADYNSLLDKAYAALPERSEHRARLEIPAPEVFREGKVTVFANFMAIVDVLNRDPQHLFKYLVSEMGTAGVIEGRRAVFQGSFSKQTIQNQLNDYVVQYVYCTECNSPDTHLERQERVLVLRCDACGATRPVKKRYARREETSPIHEGGTVRLQIESCGRKGDGIAHLDRYTIFVTNGKVGDEVDVRIKKVSGSIAFGEKV